MNALMAVCCWRMSADWECCIATVLAAVAVVLMCVLVKKRIWMLALGFLIFFGGVLIYLNPPRKQCAATAEVQAKAVANVPSCEVQAKKRSTIIGATSKSLSAFYPSRGEYEEDIYGQSPWYWLFHFLAIMYVTAILVALFGAEFVNRVLTYCRSWRGLPLNVFWGYGEEAKTIADGVEEGKRSVVFVMPEKRLWTSLSDDEDVHEIARSGWKWILGKAEELKWLSFAKRHFFMGSDGHRNVADAEALIRSYDGRSQISVYVRVGATADDDVLYKWADRWNREDGKNVEIIIVREESLVSRRFLLKNPMLQCPRIAIDTGNATVSGDFKVLLLGFGSQGEALLNDIICDSQYLASGGKRVHFEAHVFDRDCTAYGAYEEICREAVRRYNVKFDRLEVGSSVFWRRFMEEMAQKPYNRVVVCLRDDRENIYLANDIARIYREMRLSPNGVVFARVRDSLIDAYVDSTFSGNESTRTFTPFGAMRDTYSFGNLVTRKWEEGAIWLNGDYKKKPSEPHDPNLDAGNWKRASFFNKESSRASFFHQRNLLRLIGYRVDETSCENKCFNDDDPKNHLDILAEDEHLRWMAYHFVRGVKVWAPTEDEIEEMAGSAGREVVHNAIADFNAHADLVEYSSLPTVDALFDSVNERHRHHRDRDTQEKDKGFVRSEAMRRSGLGIMKI